MLFHQHASTSRFVADWLPARLLRTSHCCHHSTEGLGSAPEAGLGRSALGIQHSAGIGDR